MLKLLLICIEKPADRARGFVAWGVLVFFVLLSTAAAGAEQAKGKTQLLFYHSELCEYCDKWKKEIGVYYDKTEEAKIFPLRPVDTDEPLPEDLAGIGKMYFTPTFIVHRDGREIGRIVGYIDEDFFWGYLRPMIRKSQQAAQKSSVQPPQMSKESNLEDRGGCQTC